MPETINIKPSARILKVLGDIELADWQCLAELTDNGFDECLEIKRAGIHWPDGYQVAITLPLGTPSRDSEVVVVDTGRGMDLPTLNNAVRAGWSSNDPFSKLGLFGMGFNIATARLGRVAKLLTTRQGDTEWVGVMIDLDAIRDDFEAPVIREAKAQTSIHGTRVIISGLDQTRAGWLSRNAAQIRLKLGDVYSHLLSEQGFSLLVNNVAVKPRLACRWGDDRSVTFGSGTQAEEIPAYIPIDQPYPPADTCLRCRNWQEVGRTECAECGSDQLVRRNRRIRGWVGVQRYLHKTEFGIDFFRNGRKILRYDKRVFEWRNPNDPLASDELEYPIELGQGGRVIGEIHLDHVAVNYQKSAFDWSDRGWLAALEYLRGRGPLLPQRAQKLGYPPNDSPIARLHRGYRRNDPGYRCLVPGNGREAINAQALTWAGLFYKGEPEYQSDQVWWEAVVEHENRRTAPAPAQPENGGSAIAALVGTAEQPGETVPGQEAASGTGQGGSMLSAPTPIPMPIETEQQRIERYKSKAVQLAELSGEFGLIEFGAAVKLTTLEVSCRLVNSEDLTTPVLLVRQPSNSYAAFVDKTHPIFEYFADDPADLVLAELADHLRTRAQHRMPLAQAIALLKERHLPDRRLNLGTSAAQAREILRTVRERMAEAIAGNPERAWQFLNPDERTSTENSLINEGAHLTLEQALDSGEFLLFSPSMFLPRLVEEWPEAFMDGKVFVGPFQSVNNPMGRRLSVGRVVGYLYDAARLESVQSLSKTELVRARLSLSLLPTEISPDARATA